MAEKFAAFFQNNLQKTFLACNLYRRVLVIEKAEESQRYSYGKKNSKPGPDLRPGCRESCRTAGWYEGFQQCC